MKTTFKIIVAVLVVLISIVIGSVVSRSQNGMADSDFFTFWLGARLQSQGADIYDPLVWQQGHDLYGSTWLENPRYVYPLPLAVLMIPWGWLPLQTAAALWIALSILAGIASLFLFIKITGTNLSRLPGLLLVVGMFAFRPLIVTIRNGQFSLLYLFILVMIIYLLKKHKTFAAGLLLGLLWIKPTLGIPISGLVILFLLIKHTWNSLTGMLVSVGMLWSLGELIHPGWAATFLAQGFEKGLNVLGYSPTTWGVVNLICNYQNSCFTNWVYPVVAAIVLVSIAACIMISKQSDENDAMILAVISCLLITPYLWAYDQVLLLFPIILLTLWGIYGSRLTGMLPLILSLIAALLVRFALQSGNDILSILLTILVAGWWIISRWRLWTRTTLTHSR